MNMGLDKNNKIIAPAIFNWIVISILMVTVSGFNPLGLIGQMGIVAWFVLSGLDRGAWLIILANVVLDVWGVFFGGFVQVSSVDIAPQVDWVVALYYLTLVAQTMYFFKPRHGEKIENNGGSDAILWRALFEQANDAILILNLNHDIVDVNRRTLDLLGYAKEEMIGRSRREFVPSDEWAETVLRLTDILSGEYIPQYERRYIRKNGDTIWVEASTSLVVNSENIPVYIQTVMHDITKRKTLQEQLDEMLDEMELQAKTDSLTGLWNRRAITEYAESERSRSIRDADPFSVLMVDIDKFKYINDHYGHRIGDDALNAIAKTMQWWKRAYDWVGRWGGDEFLVVLPKTTEEDALMIANRLREKVNEIIMKPDGEPFNLETCIGVACNRVSEKERDNISLQELIDQADKALYQSKNDGGNRVTAYKMQDK